MQRDNPATRRKNVIALQQSRLGDDESDV